MHPDADRIYGQKLKIPTTRYGKLVRGFQSCGLSFNEMMKEFKSK